MFGKMALAEVPPLAVSTLRVLSGAIFLGAVAALAPGRRLRPREVPFLLLLGFTGIAANQLLFTMGLARTNAFEATILVSTIPAMTLGIAAALGRERLDRGKATGMVLAFAGVVLLVSGKLGGSATSRLVGDLLIVLNCLLYSFYLVLSKDVVRERGALRALADIFLAGAVLIVPFGGIALVAVPWGELSPRTFWSLGYTVVFATFAAYGLNAWALGRAPASTVAAYVYLQPGIAMLGAALLLGERPGPLAFGALALIVAGTFLASRATSVVAVAEE